VSPDQPMGHKIVAPRRSRVYSNADTIMAVDGAVAVKEVAVRGCYGSGRRPAHMTQYRITKKKHTVPGSQA
jgi:hypothetical protein